MKFSFLVTIILCAIFNVVLLLALDAWVLSTPLPIINYIFIGLFAVLTYLIHQQLLAVNRKSPRQFVTFFMGSITLKLFFTVTLLFVYIYLNRADRVPVALSFMATYLLFTVVEVVSLYKLMVPRV